MNKIYRTIGEVFLVTLWIIGFLWLLRGIEIPTALKTLSGLTFGWIIVKLDGIYDEVRKIRKQGEKQIKIQSQPLVLQSLKPEIDKLSDNSELDAIVKRINPDKK